MKLDTVNKYLKQKSYSIKLNKIKQNVQSIQSGEATLFQIVQLKKLNQIRKTFTEKNLSIMSIKSSEIESYRENKIIKDNENNNYILTELMETNIRKTLSNHFVFRNITSEVLDSIINQIFYCSFNKDDIIYKEGDIGNFFYIIFKGKIEATSEKNNIIKYYGEWDCFGELSLINQQKREENIKCLEDVELFSIDGIAFRDTVKRINEEIFKDKFNFINNVFIFKYLDSISKYNIAQKMFASKFKKDTKIISKGKIAQKFYIIQDGLVSCQIDNKEIKKLSINDYFCHNCILFNEKNHFDYFAIENTSCFEIAKEDLYEALGGNFINLILFCLFKNHIEKSENLKILFPENLILDVFKIFSVVIYSSKEKLFDEKSKEKYKRNPKRLIFIVDGNVYKNNNIYASKGDFIGEEFFTNYNNNILFENLICDPNLITLEVDILLLSNKIKIDLKENKHMNYLTRMNKLKNIELFKNLSEKVLGSLVSKFEKKIFPEGEVIVEEGKIANSIYLISKGRVKITKEGKYIRELESGNCFGESCLFPNNEKSTETVTAIDGKVICYLLSKKDFDYLLTDQKIQNYISKKFALQDTSIQLKDLHYIKFLGEGKFGSVSLVHNKKNLYAIKALSKQHVENDKILAKYFVYERRIMLSLDHPFIVKMVKSMKNLFYCFLLMEYINGENLNDYLNKRNEINNIYETQFYIGTLILILEYLQKKFIIHRDLKPYNLMIDSNGYIKLIDFGTAKILSNYTSTIIGTPHYIAPEILQGKGYSFSCDFWSVGICMYQIFYNELPFGNDSHEVIEIYKDILYQEVCFPNIEKKDNKIKFVNEFISDLLTKKVNKRICNTINLKRMRFFDGFSFEKLYDFSYDPPFKPKIKELNNMMEINSPYENIVKNDEIQQTVNKKEKKKYIPKDYNKNWADEF